MSLEKITYAGQNILSKCDLILMNTKAKIDLVPLVFQIEFYEDIMAPFMSGKVVLTDTFNLLTAAPIMGEEMLEIEYKTPGQKLISKLYHIYKAGNRKTQGDKKSAYELHFISIAGYYDLNQRVSAAYSGAPHEIAEQVYKEYLMSNAEKTKYPNWNLVGSKYASSNKIKFISNFWNPSRIISYCASQAQYTSSKGFPDIPNYLFFEGVRDQYFVPLDYLYEQKPKAEYIFDQNPGTKKDETNKSSMDIERQFKTILNLEILEYFDYLKRSMSGALSHQVFEYNMLNKRWSGQGNRIKEKQEAVFSATKKPWWNGPRQDHDEYNEKQGADDGGGYYYNYHYYEDRIMTNHLDNGSENNKDYGSLQGDFISWNDVNAKISTKITHSEMHDGVEDKSADILTKRLPLLAQTEMVKFRITVNGHSGLEVGDCIMLYMPMLKQLGTMDTNQSKDDVYDKYWTGKYLVTNIRHSMTQRDHMMVLDICRDVVSKDFEYMQAGKTTESE